MKQIFTTLLIAIISTNCLADDGDFVVKGFSYVKHHKAKSKGAWVETFDNHAIGFDYVLKETDHTEQDLGVNIAQKNSFGNFGVTAQYTGRLCVGDSLRACTGLQLGGAYGYKPQTGLLITPAGAIVNRVEYKGFGIEHSHIPTVDAIKLVGFDSLMLTYRFKLK